jgi:DNA invertase Pin-like site-specific DNA recombinase
MIEVIILNALQERPDMDTLRKLPIATLNGNSRQGKINAALYNRLSREEYKEGDQSTSIGNSRRMLSSYAKDKGYTVYDEYIDDGVSGTTFDRDDFQRMVRDIKAERVNKVIVKDLSRLGRNYAETDYYVEEFFPEHGVRLIAIDGSYDGNSEDNEYAPFANFFNEYFARQTSKKMKAMRKSAAKNGEFMGSMTPYGYKRSTENKRKLVIDEEAAQVVRRIYGLYKNGESMRHIADILNRESVLPPQAYYFASMGKENPYDSNAKTWCSATISAILQRDTYLGHMTQGKKRTKSFKDKKILFVPEDQWQTKENTHDPIIDDETFNAVQLTFLSNKNAKPRRTAVGNEPSLFSNLLRCKECGAKLNFNTWNRRGGSEHFYRCSRYIQHKNCTPHRISLELLTNVVLADVQYYARLAAEDEETFARQLNLLSMKDQTAVIDRYKKRIAEINTKIAKIDRLLQAAFEKNECGVISDTVYANLERGYMKDRDALEAELPTLTASLELAESKVSDVSKEVANLKQYAKVMELTRDIATNLINTIHISEPVKNGKHKGYCLEIEYSFNNPRSITRELFSGSETYELVGSLFDWHKDLTGYAYRGKIDTVFVTTLSSISCDYKIVEKFIGWLKGFGVRVIALDEPNEESDTQQQIKKDTVFDQYSISRS